MKAKHIVGLLALAFLSYVVYQSFYTVSDITFWTWFGIKFGINWSSNTEVKILTILLIFCWGYLSLETK